MIDERSAPPREGESFADWCTRVGGTARDRLDVGGAFVWSEGRWAHPHQTRFALGGSVPVAPKVIA